MDIRLREAKQLLDQKSWDGAYYLAGYCVEFALKVRIISQLMKSDSYPTQQSIKDFYNHQLPSLCKLAGLEDEMIGDPTVRLQWLVVRQWTEQSRYVFDKTEAQATDMYQAIEQGVLPWIKARY